jgi:hypothetical protein
MPNQGFGLTAIEFTSKWSMVSNVVSNILEEVRFTGAPQIRKQNFIKVKHSHIPKKIINSEWYSGHFLPLLF